MPTSFSNPSRRQFLKYSSLLSGAFLLDAPDWLARPHFQGKPALPLAHFPDRLHALIWRNWNLVSAERLAKVVKAQPGQIRKIARAMRLPPESAVTPEQWQRSYLTIIRRNWHLLPQEQLLELMDWTAEQLAFTLQEDDFFYIKLGSLKPECEPVLYTETSPASLQWLRQTLQTEFPKGLPRQKESYFQFVKDLSAPSATPVLPASSQFNPRFGYAYFSLFGDPLLEPDIDPYPDGYLEKMVAAGMDGTWMHIVLSKLTPFPWDPAQSANWEKRLENLSNLIKRTGKAGIGIYLYLNEPRNQTPAFFARHPDLKGAGNSLCTSHPEVQRYLTGSIATIVEAAPGLAGFFSITASENPTHCWSHGKGGDCPRCSKRTPAEVVAELNNLYAQGIASGLRRYQEKSQDETLPAPPRLIVWDWGWTAGWAEAIMPLLPKTCSFMSVSEWDLPISRGGIESKVGEYSISSVGPGPRASKHWQLAQQQGLTTIAKIQAGNTWEIAAVPYIPAMANVARHVFNLKKAGIEGLMLGWTLGGYPSPNLEIVAAIGAQPDITPAEALLQVAQRRYGAAAPLMVTAWEQFSAAFSEFPYHIGVVYNAPLQTGPSNLLWEQPTGYRSTMVGIPYDDLTSWRAVYPEHIFVSQLLKVVNGFQQAIDEVARKQKSLRLPTAATRAVQREMNIAQTIAIHYKSIANQAEFIRLRNQLQESGDAPIRQIETLLRDEIRLAKQMAVLQCNDSRLGFEASNHYFYTPADLLEKVLNCRDLLDRWLPALSR